jgi:hypothetical protein
MSLSKFTGDTNNIQSLPDQPSISASELKAKFDKTGADIKEYINNTLTEEIDTELGNKANSNNVYNKNEVDELTNGIILAENVLLWAASHIEDRINLSDTIANYKCIELILNDGTVKRIYNPENSSVLNPNTILYIEEITAEDNNNYIVLSRMVFKFRSYVMDVVHGECKHYRLDVNDGKIEVSEGSGPAIRFRKIIGYK